jgi:hypothetical protein
MLLGISHNSLLSFGVKLALAMYLFPLRHWCILDMIHTQDQQSTHHFQHPVARAKHDQKVETSATHSPQIARSTRPL